MTFTRIVCGPDGESRFEDEQLTLAVAWQSQRVRLQPVPPGHTSPFHPEPSPTLATVLQGWIEIATSLGETRRFGPGEAMLFLDTEGKGHAFTSAPEPTIVMIARLQDGMSLPFKASDHLPD